MGTEPAAHGGSRPSTADGAVSLDRYADVTTHEGELLVYDVDQEEAWIQTDVYYSCDAIV